MRNFRTIHIVQILALDRVLQWPSKKTICYFVSLSYNHLYHNALFGNMFLKSGGEDLILRKLPFILGDGGEGDLWNMDET